MAQLADSRYRWTRPAPRPRARASAKVVRAAPPIPRERQAPELTAAPTRERPGGLHLHFHGVSAEDVAAIIERHRHHG
jgi:hypothetical protein